MPSIAPLSPAAQRALRALNERPDKRLSFSDFRRATCVKARAYYPLATRLEDQLLICRHGDGYELTFRGMRAIAEAEAA